MILHTLAGAALAARRYWVHHVAPDTIQGSDRFMLRWAQRHGVRSYGAFAVSFGSTSDAEFAEAVATIRASLAEQLADPRSAWRRGVDVEAGTWAWRDDLDLDTLVDEVDTDEAFFAIGDPAQRDIVVRLHRGRHLLGVLFDHTVWDGIRVVNECLAPTISAHPFSSKWLLKDTYRPVLDEAAVLYTGWSLAGRALTYRPLPHFEGGEGQQVVKHLWHTADIKADKDRIGVPFSAAIVARYGRTVLDWLPAERRRVRIGIIVGFQSDRFRNNYSMLAVDVRRGDDLKTAAKRVHAQMKRRQLEVVGLYNLANSFDVESFFKGRIIDVLFSPAFFDPHEGLSQQVVDMSFFNVPSSTPLYAFACSIGDRITVCTTNNCPDVDAHRLAAGAAEVFRYDAKGALQAYDPVPRP